MGLNYSSRRHAVLQVLQATKEHPTAETIYEECKKIIPSISLGTVYRNLVMLEQHGEIIKVATVNGCDRYDADIKPHAHCICPKCGRVQDVDISSGLKNALQKECDNKKYDETQLTFYSLCKDCRKLEK